MNNYKQKQEQSIAQEVPIVDQSSPHRIKINLFLSEPSKQIQSQKPQIPYNEYQTRQQEQLNSVNQNQQKQRKRKMSQWSDNYHRVKNSRKIKTKKTKKQHLERSEYFYFDKINQQNQESSTMKLLNDYEAFHQMIIDSNFSHFQRKIIKLNHYGNKKKYSSKQSSLAKKQKKYNQNISQYILQSQRSKNLSKSFVDNQNQLNRSIVCEQKKKFKPFEISKSRSDKKGIQKNQTLSKYTTPIRTIFLNKSQQSPNKQLQTLRSSSSQKVTSWTPLRSEREQKVWIQKPFDSCIQNNKKDKIQSEINDENSKIYILRGKSAIITEDVPYQQSKEQVQSKPGLIVVSCPRNWKKDPHKEQRIVKKLRLNTTQLQNSNCLPISNRHSQSHSRSKKGLSLTQSSCKNLSQNKSQYLVNKSISKPVNNERENQLVLKKLDPRGMYSSKRVQIRIY